MIEFILIFVFENFFLLFNEHYKILLLSIMS